MQYKEIYQNLNTTDTTDKPAIPSQVRTENWNEHEQKKTISYRLDHSFQQEQFYVVWTYFYFSFDSLFSVRPDKTLESGNGYREILNLIKNIIL